MKIKLLPIVLFIVCFSNLSFGQLTNVNNISPNGIFDKVFNRFGDKLNIEDLLIDKNGDGTTKALGPLCSSGYFDLYFEVGSGMEGNSAIELARRAVVCQVFSDLSQFIQTPNPNVHVNILIKNINSELPGYNPISNPNPAASSNVAGLASAYYAVPSAPTPLVGGIADNEIWKTINSGIDSYTNFVSPLIIKGGNPNNYGIYHGYLAINFNNLSINWHSDLSQSTSTGLYDLYSVVLHEVTHALGFASLIKVNGTSKFGTSYPYYSRYDLELETSSNLPLITNQGSCSLYSYAFNPLLSTTILTPTSPNCSNQIRYIGSIDQAVYTPSVFSEGSSLSHLEDSCHLPNSYPSNQYYTMSHAIGTGPNFMKRYLKPEERDVLCDIGYKVNSNFGNSSNLNFYDYGAPACPGAEVIGINDGIDPNGNVQFYTVVNNSSNPLPITNICNNDFNGFTFECLEDLYGNGYPINITSNGFSYVATSPGIAVLRYVPVSATGARGNITYVYIYISANNCTPTNCNFLNNGDFELSTNCGQMDYQSPINSACWSPLSNTPDIFLRNCTNTVNNTNLNLSIPANFASFPSIESWNGAPNNSFIGIVSTSSHYNESIQTPLNAPLIDGHTYTISFYARCGNIYMPLGSSGNLIIGGTTNFLAPYGIAETVLPSNIIQLGNAVSVINDLNWHLITQTFIYTGQSNLNHLVIYNSSNLNTLTGQSNVYLYIDQVELTEIQTTINLTLPQVICINQTINDLSLYAPITGGTFNGPGVSLTGNTYSFNPQIAGVGTHTISYTYTNNLNCPITISQQIEVVNSTFTTSINASSTQICSGQTVSLTASSSSPATYNWNPGNLTGTSISPIINSNTLFSLTATNAQGCVTTSSINLTSLPFSLGVTPTSSSICSGQSDTLTATGADSYVWSPSTGLSSTTGGVVTATPTSSTTYTVTGTSSNGCIGSFTIPITVNPLPTIQISPMNPTICSGDYITMTASGADTYNWSPSSGLTSYLGSNFMVNPSVTTTYIVNGQNSQGCTAHESVTVTVNPIPTVSVSSTYNNICSGQQVTLTANGALYYSWPPSTGLPLSIGSSVIVSPNATITYYVNGVDANGCSATSSINLIVNSCNDCYTGTLLSGNISSSPSTGATLRIANNISIIGNVTFTSNNVKIMPGVTITVKPNSTLTLNGSHLYGCESMWQGIVVEEGGKVILQPYSIANVIQKTTLIEDATIAIDYKPILNQQSSFVLTSNNATFNKNETAIRIQSYLFNNVSSVFEVKNCLFTSRNLYNSTNSTWPLTSIVKSQNGNASFNPLLNPYISSNYVVSDLKFPLSNQKPKRGLDINYTGNTLVSSPVIYNSLTIGSLTSSEYNVFDNIKVDIYSLNSNIKIQNTVMQFTVEIPYYPEYVSTPIGEPAIGTGIFLKSDNSFVNKLDVAGSASLPNQFYGLSTAVLTDNIKEVLFNYNTIRSNRSNMNNYLSIANGERGVYIREINKFDNVQVNNNTFYSINKGMSLIADVAGISPTINVLNNVFKKSSIQLAGGGISTYSVLIENANSTNQMFGGNIWVNSNTIYNTINGIKLNSWKRINQQINNNYISFGKNVTIVNGSVQQEDMIGIRLVNCVLGSINTQIYTNTLIGAVAYNTQNSYYRAISIESSIGNDLKCNDVSNSYSGLYFSSNCNPTKTSKNNMANHKFGFVLDDSGIIGQQGSPTSPVDNVWSTGTNWTATNQSNTTNIGQFKCVYLNSSNSVNSKMYVRQNINSYTPIGSVGYSNTSYQYTTTNNPVTLYYVPNAPLLTNCLSSGSSSVNALSTLDLVNALDATVSLIVDTSSNVQQDILLSDLVYRTLASDSSLLNYSSNLISFYDTTATKNIGALYDVELDLAKDSTLNAVILYDSIISNNLIEESYKVFYEAYINYQMGSFTDVDSLKIRTLAEGCPTLQGSAVYMAEALYNIVYFESELFTPTCPNYIEKNSISPSFNDNFNVLSIYPVPNDGTFTINGEFEKNQTISIISWDGKVVFSKNIEVKQDQIQINSNLASGIYFLIQESHNKLVVARIKFIVTK